MVTIATFTPGAAQQNLQNDGLDALGLTSVLLSPRWADTTPTRGDYNASTLTLRLSNLRAPFRGIREFTSQPAEFSDPTGNPLTGSAALLRLHPQAVLRLEQLATGRYGPPLIRPVPWAIVIRGMSGTTTPQWYEADEVLSPSGGEISFHDGRGLIIDPIAVAALLADLLTAFPALKLPSAGGSLTGAGGMGTIAGLATGTLIHVIDPHGHAYQTALAGATMVTTDGSGTVTATVPSHGLVTLPPGQRLQAATTDQNRLRWGWAMNSTLDRAPLTVPNLPSTGSPPPSLPRQFLRVCAVDTQWHLLGNRTSASVQGIGPDDGTMPASLQPRVRDRIVMNYLGDGVDVLATGGQVLNRLSGTTGLLFAVSPTLDSGVGVPPAPGAFGHWNQFPPPNTLTGFPTPPQSPAQGITATWAGEHDVVVTIAATQVPNGAHVRIYPQRFVEIIAIGEQLSFERGDGGAAIADGIQPVHIRLPNPLGLLPGQPRPSSTTVTLDIVVKPRVGDRRLWAAVPVPVSSTPAPIVTDPFATPDPMAVVPNNVRSIGPVPLFGLPRTVTPPGGAPSSALDLVRRLASETTPRQGPRLPTMARFETVVVTGTANPATSDGTLLWEGVLSGGRWARETRSSQHAEGNPGNPAGPDLHAPGIHVTGALAFDLARHAVRRVQPIIPLPGGGTAGWLIFTAGNNFNPPAAGAPTDTGVGALLQTVAAVCETPELSLPAVDLSPDTLTLNDVVTRVSSALGVSPPSISATNGDRLVDEVRREFFVARHGIRDALWALRRALNQARELIYIESPQFARTARPGSSPQPHEIDLVAELAQRLNAHPNLRVVICTPRYGDFAPIYKGFSRQAFRARNEAINELKAIAADRVVAFHPIGFPGRAAAIRTTTVIVDDVWCMVGTSHFRRRGMTFDGGADIVSFDRQFEAGYSKKVREFRRNRMATQLRLVPPVSIATASGDWLRLGRPGSAFEVVADTLAQGGFGRILPLWAGPTDTAILPATDDMADPDGAKGSTFVTLFAGLLNEIGD